MSRMKLMFGILLPSSASISFTTFFVTFALSLSPFDYGWKQKCPSNQIIKVKLWHRLEYRWISIILSGSDEDSWNFLDVLISIEPS